MSLRKLASESKIMEVELRYNGEKIKFHLGEELKITQNQMATEIKEQPKVYAFIAVLHKKLIIQYESLESEREKVFGKQYTFYKTSKNTKYYQEYHKPPSDDATKSLVLSSEKYTEHMTKLLAAKHDMLVIGSIVRAFEQKADLIQTLSANIRKEAL
jgi:flagellar motility protein MotE (MotC chaperone)